MSDLLDPVDLCAQIESLRRQLEEARKDAERYRWLRDKEFDLDYADKYGLDAAIDAAMEEE